MAGAKDRFAAAVAAVRAGDLVAYPTETVYGLGADALEPDAIGRVFEAKSRPRDRPISFAVAEIDQAAGLVRPGPVARRFIAAFLPGPVTVVCERTERVPAALTGGRSRVGLRIPAHDLARSLLEATGPLTATSANVSGGADVREPAELDPAIREAVRVVIDGGRTPGGSSTVVDPDLGVIHRRGRLADEIEQWLADGA